MVVGKFIDASGERVGVQLFDNLVASAYRSSCFSRYRTECKRVGFPVDLGDPAVDKLLRLFNTRTEASRKGAKVWLSGQLIEGFDPGSE